MMMISGKEFLTFVCVNFSKYLIEKQMKYIHEYQHIKNNWNKVYLIKRKVPSNNLVENWERELSNRYNFYNPLQNYFFY